MGTEYVTFKIIKLLQNIKQFFFPVLYCKFINFLTSSPNKTNLKFEIINNYLHFIKKSNRRKYVATEFSIYRPSASKV